MSTVFSQRDWLFGIQTPIICDCISTYTDALLDEAKDFRAVNRAVYTARGKWNPLGTELKVAGHIITNLNRRDPPEDNLEAILRAWLKSPDLKPCWANLVKALREITVGEGGVAQAIITDILGMLYAYKVGPFNPFQPVTHKCVMDVPLVHKNLYGCFLTRC